MMLPGETKPTMRSRVFLSILLLAAFAAISAVAQQDEIAQVEQTWANSLMKADYATFEKLLSNDFMYVHSGGNVQERASFVGDLTSGKARYEKVEVTDMKIMRHGDAAVVSGKLQMSGVSNGGQFNVRGILAHVWVKEGGAWKLVLNQTTRTQQ